MGKKVSPLLSDLSPPNILLIVGKPDAALLIILLFQLCLLAVGET